jgi:hypothetical protein
MKLLYVAGPYRSKDGPRGVHKNIEAASDVAYDLWKLGAAVICPHKNSEGFDGADFFDAELWLKGDLVILGRCDAIVMLPGWETSAGAGYELMTARTQGKPVFLWETQRGALYDYLKD